MLWKCDDGNCEIEIEATTARAAARHYVRSGDWNEDGSTFWVKVWVWAADSDGDDRESFKIEVEPSEPRCRGGQDHDWQSPIEWVGGIRENPGVWGHGGGVIIHEGCTRCGCGRTTDTWAQDRSDGEQGLTSVRYEPHEYDLDQLRSVA
jgi:hypothetical protein